MEIEARRKPTKRPTQLTIILIAEDDLVLCLLDYRRYWFTYNKNTMKFTKFALAACK